jgi:hypothetical protein
MQQAKFVCLAFGAALALFVLGEFIRLSRLPPFGQSMHLFMQKYLDSRDAGAVILTHTYLLLGCAMPLWLHAFFLSPSSPPSSSNSSIISATTSTPLSSPSSNGCDNVISASISAHLSLSSPHTFLPALAGVLVLGIGDAVVWTSHHITNWYIFASWMTIVRFIGIVSRFILGSASLAIITKNL